MHLSDELFNLWVKKLQQRGDRKSKFTSKSVNNTASYTGKRYLHLDVPIENENPEDWKDTLLNEKAVSQRAFYPFLRNIKRNKRFHTNENGIRCRHPEGPKERPICSAAHRDSLVYSWYSFLLEYLLEKRLNNSILNDCVLAYRTKGKNNLHFAKEVFEYVASKDECTVLAFDVKGFFDNIDHSLLKRAWADLLGGVKLPSDHYTVFKSMTRFRVIDATAAEETLGEKEFAKCFHKQRIAYPKIFREKLLEIQITNPNKFGIPQGAPLSSVLSNLYMYKVDLELQQFANSHNGIYRRYSDDLLLVVPKNVTELAISSVENLLSSIKLNLNSKKTEIKHFDRTTSKLRCLNEEGKSSCIQYLGLEFNGEIIRIRPASLARFHHRLRRGVQKAVSHALYRGSLHRGKVFKRKLYEKFSHLGDCNFISYSRRASFITNSSAINKQLGDTVILVNNQIKRELARHANPDFLVKRVKAKNFRKPKTKI